MKKVIRHFQLFQKSIINFSDEPPTQAKIYRRFKKLGDGVSDVLSKSFQRRMGLEVVDELVEIEGQSPYCTSEYLA